MTEPKFTPGPWCLIKIQEWPWGIRVEGADGYHILEQSAYAHGTMQKSRRDCEMGIGFGRDMDKAAAAIETQDANAALIASAPELYAALELAVTSLEAAGYQFPIGRAALSAARGEGK